MAGIGRWRAGRRVHRALSLTVQEPKVEHSSYDADEHPFEILHRRDPRREVDDQIESEIARFAQPNPTYACAASGLSLVVPLLYHNVSLGKRYYCSVTHIINKVERG